MIYNLRAGVLIRTSTYASGMVRKIELVNSHSSEIARINLIVKWIIILNSIGTRKFI